MLCSKLESQTWSEADEIILGYLKIFWTSWNKFSPNFIFFVLFAYYAFVKF